MKTKLHPSRCSGLALRVALTLLLVATGTEAAAGWQLCLGAEGHVEIEPRGACERPASELPGTDPTTTSAPDECDPCRDVLLGVESNDALRAARPSAYAQIADAVSVEPKTASSPVAPRTANHHLSQLSIELRLDAGPLPGLRTVVLLI